MLTEENLNDHAAELAPRLPPFPPVVRQIFDLLDDDNASLEMLVRAARNDGVIAAGILSCANRMRRTHRQADLDDPFVATSIIGINQVRRILTVAARNNFASDDQDAIFLLNHSRAVAIVAQELAFVCGVSPELAHMAGILLDIGQLALFTLDREKFVALQRSCDDDEQMLAREQEAFGVHHATLGAALASHWMLPRTFVHAIERHHEEPSANDRLQAVLCLAESLTRALDIPPSPKHKLHRLNGHAQALLGIDWSSPAMHDLIGRCWSRYRHAAA